MRVAFGEYQLDSKTRTLQREGRRIPVQSKAFDLLAYLIERRDQVVSSDELLDALWPGLHVTPAALSTAVQKARQAVGDDGEHQKVIHTEHGKGFRFIAEVTDLLPPENARSASTGLAQMSLISELKRRNVFRVAAAYGIVGWLLVEMASVVLPALRLPDWTLTLLVFLVIAGFPLALVVAWAFELTPEGIKRESAVDPAESITHLTGRKLDFAIIGLLALAVVFLFVDHYVLEEEVVQPTQPVAGGTSIAVLPFANMSADPDQAYFADGIAEELLNTLAQMRGLRVPGRTSSFSFRDSDADLKTIGEALDVEVILEGSVRKAGDRVRITAQLVDAKDGFHRWSETYDREFTDIFAIQTEIATAIADALRLTLSTEERERLTTPPTQNLEAYQAYLLGKQLVAKFDNAPLAESVDYFQQAIELDPDFALAYVALADAYLWQAAISGFPRDEMRAKAQAAIDKAIELDNQLREAHATLGFLRHERSDYEGAEAAYLRALELNPNYAPTYEGYGWLLRDEGRFEEALALNRKALEVDPVSATFIVSIGHALSGLGRFEEALVQYKKALEIDPDYVGARLDVANYYYDVEGQLDRAMLWYAKGLSLDPGSSFFSALLGVLFLDLGDPNEGERWIKRSIELGPERFWPNHAMQRLGVYQGDAATAWDYGRKAVELWWNPGKYDGLALTPLRDHELKAGRYFEARALYEISHPELLNPEVPEVFIWNRQAAIDLALVLSRTGERARADLLLNRSFQIIQTLPRLGDQAGYGIADVQIYALRGEKQKALSALREAIDAGWRDLWWYFLKHDLNLESLHDEPEFQAMVAEIEADMATQLARVREMERNGELEPIPEITSTTH